MVVPEPPLVWAPVMRLVSVQPRAEMMARPELEESRMAPPEAEYLPQRLGCRPGRLRPAAQGERRLEECAKLGLSTVVAPAGTKAANGRIVVEAAETLRQAIRAGLDGDRSEGDD